MTRIFGRFSGHFDRHGRTLVLKMITAFGLNESQGSSDTSIRLANWFRADPLVEVLISQHT